MHYIRFAVSLHKIRGTSVNKTKVMRLLFCITFGLQYLCTQMQTIREFRMAQTTDAPIVARLIMDAMTEECCQYYYGSDHSLEDFHTLLTELVERDDTQYSYRNTICAIAEDGQVAGICVSYDGGQLLTLRQAFVTEVKKRFGRDFSNMPAETEAGELYIDSMAVIPHLRGRGGGKQLFRAVEKRAKQLGLNTLGLLVDRGNPDAERLYRSIGYRHVGDTEWGGHLLKHMQKELDPK